MIDERAFKEQLLGNVAKLFEQYVKHYDDSVIPMMKARGYSCIHSTERTVAFTFGEFTFRRRRWKKVKHWIVPVDDELGLEKNTRYSKEFMYQVAKLATLMSYDSVVKVIQLMYHIVITKPTVVKAVKQCHELLEERKEYQSYQYNKRGKESVNTIFVEGDSFLLKACSDYKDSHYFDFSHFVVHTGSQPLSETRSKLQGKKEFVSLDGRKLRLEVLEYLYSRFDITEETMLITNSDGGKGYTPYVFKELASDLGIKQHEHFWDAYHVTQYLKQFYKSLPDELYQKAQKAIQKHDKSQLRMVLDTIESLLKTDEEIDQFQKFKNKLLKNFQYTKPAVLRGIRHKGIGIMESQHRKITYRMKRRGMYWSLEGAEAMSQMILLVHEDSLRELFFGNWKEEYDKIQTIEGMSGGEIKAIENRKYRPTMPTGKITWKNFKL